MAKQPKQPDPDGVADALAKLAGGEVAPSEKASVACCGRRPRNASTSLRSPSAIAQTTVWSGVSSQVRRLVAATSARDLA